MAKAGQVSGIGGLEGIAAAVPREKGLPPIHLWNPPFCGDIDMRIAKDGTWFYQKTPIGRPSLVKLFASVLKREGDKLVDLRVAFTGTNPRPVLLEGTAELCGDKLDDRAFKRLDALVRDQIMPMKTTFTPGHYRRRVAGVLARRLLTRLFES